MAGKDEQRADQGPGFLEGLLAPIRRLGFRYRDWGDHHHNSDCCLRIIVGGAVLLALVRWFAGEISTVFEQRSTTTITAETEALSFAHFKDRTQSWSLPPGIYSFFGKATGDDCQTSDFGGFYESRCTLSGNSRMDITGHAEVTFQISPAGSFLLSITEQGACQTDSGTPLESCPFEATLIGSDDLPIMTTGTLLSYEAKPGHAAIRLPLIGASATLGSNLSGASAIEGTPYDYWQPVLHSGDIRIIATNIPGEERYGVLEERLDRGDVLRVGSLQSPTSIWGMAEILPAAPRQGRGVPPEYRLQTVLHTSLSEVQVTRFGSPGGHLINVSKWTVLLKWPNGQQTWVVLFSASIIVTFLIQVSRSKRDARSDRTSTDDDIRRSPPEQPEPADDQAPALDQEGETP